MRILKKLSFLILTIPMLISCNLSSNPCESIKEKELKDALKSEFSIVEKNEVKGTNLCQVVIEKNGIFNIFYTTADGKTFIFGDVFKDGVFLNKATLDRLNEKTFLNFKQDIEKLVAFSYKPDGATKYVYFITDPDCPFCERSKEAIKQWADSRKVEIKVVFFPLEQLHPQAKDKAIKAVCSGMNYNDYVNSKWRGQNCQEGLKKIEDSIALMQKLNINGTPSFISYNGKRALGFSPENLDKIIN